RGNCDNGSESGIRFAPSRVNRIPAVITSSATTVQLYLMFTRFPFLAAEDREVDGTETSMQMKPGMSPSRKTHGRIPSPDLGSSGERKSRCPEDAAHSR